MYVEMMEIKPSVPTVLHFWRICTTIRILTFFLHSQAWLSTAFVGKCTRFRMTLMCRAPHCFFKGFKIPFSKKRLPRPAPIKILTLDRSTGQILEKRKNTFDIYLLFRQATKHQSINRFSTLHLILKQTVAHQCCQVVCPAQKQLCNRAL
jgi:hypothetical protein